VAATLADIVRISNPKPLPDPDPHPDPTHQEPLVAATLADITCDSDGKLDKFVSAREGVDFDPILPLHRLEPGSKYYLAMFLTGAHGCQPRSRLFAGLTLTMAARWWAGKVVRVDADTAAIVMLPGRTCQPVILCKRRSMQVRVRAAPCQISSTVCDVSRRRVPGGHGLAAQHAGPAARGPRAARPGQRAGCGISTPV